MDKDLSGVPTYDQGGDDFKGRYLMACRFADAAGKEATDYRETLERIVEVYDRDERTRDPYANPDLLARELRDLATAGLRWAYGK